MGIFDGKPTQQDVDNAAAELERKKQEVAAEQERVKQQLAQRERENAENKRKIEEAKRKAGVNSTGFFG